MNLRVPQKGITLIELLLYVSIITIILFSVTSFLFSLLEARVKTGAIMEVEQQGVFVLQTITQTIRNGGEVYTPELGDEDDELFLEVFSDTASSTTVTLVDGTIYVTERIDDEEEGELIPLTNSRVIASDLSFQNLSYGDGSTTIRITFTLSHVNPEGRQEYAYVQTFTSAATVRTYDTSQ